MNIQKGTIDEEFYQVLAKHMDNGTELSTRQIYSLFPGMNHKTISWRLHKFIALGKLHRIGRGEYSLLGVNENNAAGYDYLHKSSQRVYDIAMDYGYNYYITGLDSLIGEIPHVPEKYPVLLVVEDDGIGELQHMLNDNEFLVVTEKERGIIDSSAIRDKIDVIILRGKNFDMAVNNIAQKEKGFVDLYYVVTRLEYGISVQELFHIYQNLVRNHSLSTFKMKAAAKERGIYTEIDWLTGFHTMPDKAKEFMKRRIEDK